LSGEDAVANTVGARHQPMRDTYLEITYRKGRAVAAYLHVASDHGALSAESRKVADQLVADFDEQGRLIGVEILSPRDTSFAAIKSALQQLHAAPVSDEELEPLKAA